MKQMKKIVDKNGSVLEEPNAIMNEVQYFYERFYKSRDVEDCEINELKYQNYQKSNKHLLKEK